MKRRIPSLFLSLLLLSLTACGSEIQNPGSHSASLDAVCSLIDLPVQEPEENLPDDSQAPGSGNPGDSSQGNLPADKSEAPDNSTLDEDGWYSSKEEVALYIHLYNRLPDNYVTKEEAEKAGWHGGNVEDYTGEGTAIGGSYFGNREGLLPKAQGRSYTECDIDTVGENARGAKRIVFSNDGLIYYTEDHYESFELLYGEP